MICNEYGRFRGWEKTTSTISPGASGWEPETQYFPGFSSQTGRFGAFRGLKRRIAPSAEVSRRESL